MVKCLRFAIPDSLDEPPQEVGGAVIHLMIGLHLSVLPLFGQFYLSEVVLAFTKEVVTSLISLPNSAWDTTDNRRPTMIRTFSRVFAADLSCFRSSPVTTVYMQLSCK